MSTNKDLSNYRLEQAGRCLRTAKLNFTDDDYKSAANRSYYCVFHCIRSLLALEQVDFKRHTGVISHFREKYISTGIFETKLSDVLGMLFKVRSRCDYDDFYLMSKQEISEQIENAEYFLEQVKAYLDSQK